jgi:hypothetical protein
MFLRELEMPRRLLVSETPRPERAIGQKHALNPHLVTNLNPLAGVVNQPTLALWGTQRKSKRPDFRAPRVHCHQRAALFFV